MFFVPLGSRLVYSVKNENRGKVSMKRQFSVAAIFSFLAFEAVAAPPSCIMPAGSDELVFAVLAEINQVRAAHQRPALHPDSLLMQAALGHACENAFHDRLSHFGIDGSSPGDRVLRVGYDYRIALENVAIGYALPRDVVSAWMRSAGHRENLLATGHGEIGIGIAQGRDGRRHWVMKTGLRRS